MDELLQKFQGTNQKAAKLERLLLRLRQDHDQMQAKIEALTKALEEKDREITALTEKYEALNRAKSLNNGPDVQAIQAKIDDYLKEIDICLKNFGD
ncbi:MAG: hypothetical protein SF052_12845 [Bacteroidia bacterium]|nr:hypothetical protein [Bacteroidia bacterium]